MPALIEGASLTATTLHPTTLLSASLSGVGFPVFLQLSIWIVELVCSFKRSKWSSISFQLFLGFVQIFPYL